LNARVLWLALLAVAFAPHFAWSQPSFERSEIREPCIEQAPSRLPFFGDLHVHTAFSLDASTQGTRARPADAYRFARGERLGIQPFGAQGEPLRSLALARSLDFAAVTDHAELFGELSICLTPGLPGHGSLICRIYRGWPRVAFFLMNSHSSGAERPVRYGFCGAGGAGCREAARTPWREMQQAAEDAYDRSSACSFTTFVGYEWTGGANARNLHRNVLFRNHVVPELPASYVDEPTPEGLWRALRADCLEPRNGCDVLTIPHNSNLSGGLMFRTQKSDGSPIDRAWALERAAFEPLVEVMQHKGDSECRLGPGSPDELCGFEKLPYDNFGGRYSLGESNEPAPANFVRNALAQGLLEEQRLGANPFKYGLVASTDTHIAAPGYVSERAHPGHGGAGPPVGRELPRGLPDAIEFNPGGLAVLWAEENSRDALFAAMQRREAYGTSGPRMIVRFFGGFGYHDDLCQSRAFAEEGYAGGVPMGGDLPRAPTGAGRARAPVFAVLALRDAGPAPDGGTPLQRIQIVKGWLEEGELREKVYDVAGDAGNGAGVDPATCERRGDGFESLCAVWHDPDFDVGERAFYYARVLENPSCRWSAHVCNAHAVDCSDEASVAEGLEPCCDASVPRTIQERAWTSPIWYAPGSPR
jgi:hypothetical protein